MTATNTTSGGDTDISAEATSAILGLDSQAEGDTDTTEAGSKAEETHTDSQTGDESDADGTADDKATDDKTTETEDDKWLRNKGVDPSDPKAVAAAWKKAEQEFHKTRQSKPSESIQATVTKDETVQALDEIAGLDPTTVKLQRDVSEMRFFMEHTEITDRNAVQAEIVAAAKKFPKLAADFDLETLYAIAKSERVSEVETKAEARGRKAKAEEVERTSSTAVSEGNASSGAATEDNDFMKGFNSKG